MGMRYVGEQPIAKRSKRHEAARREALHMAKSPFTYAGVMLGFALSGYDTLWLAALIFCLGLVWTIGTKLHSNYHSHDPEQLEKLEREFWMSDKALAKLPKPIDWDEFSDAVELRLLEKGDPWAPVDTADIIYRAERDMNYVWPQGAEWACPDCKHRLNRPPEHDCPFCGYVLKDDEFVPAPSKGVSGSGPYHEAVFDGPDGPVIETIHEDPRTGDRTIVSSRKVQPSDCEGYDVDQILGDVQPMVTSRHNWSGTTDLSAQAVSAQALGLFQIPPHIIGSSRPEDFHISRSERLQQELAEAVRRRQITYEQAQNAIQRLMRYG